jgi:uncharacterized protein (TIGR03437 family)
MSAKLVVLFLAAAWVGVASDCVPQAPCFDADSVVNSASNKPGLAPGTLATIYGKDLAYRTGVNGGVRVFLDQVPMQLLYVTSDQINFVIPLDVEPGRRTLDLARDGTAGPQVKITLHEFAPALFQSNPDTAVALRWPDYSLATDEIPARREDWAILYATGLGLTHLPPDTMPAQASPILRRKDFRLLLDGAEVDNSRIPYVGAAPGYWDVYQINLLVPPEVGNNPEIRISVAGEVSPAGVHLPLQ